MRVYKINLLNLPPVYKATKREVRSWVKRNPGECQSWEEVDVVSELSDLASALFNLEHQIEQHRPSGESDVDDC